MLSLIPWPTTHIYQIEELILYFNKNIHSYAVDHGNFSASVVECKVTCTLHCHQMAGQHRDQTTPNIKFLQLCSYTFRSHLTVYRTLMANVTASNNTYTFSTNYIQFWAIQGHMLATVALFHAILRGTILVQGHCVVILYWALNGKLVFAKSQMFGCIVISFTLTLIL